MFYFALGAIWTKVKTNFEWWEADIVFRITGRGRIGADGLVCIGTLVGVSYLKENLMFSILKCFREYIG
jgi:hypothetical protein